MHYTIKTTKNSFLWLDLFVSYFCIFIQLCLFLSILYIQLAFSSEELFNLFLASICKIKVFPKLKLYYIKFFFGIHFCRYLMSTLLISLTYCQQVCFQKYYVTSIWFLKLVCVMMCSFTFHRQSRLIETF